MKPTTLLDAAGLLAACAAPPPPRPALPPVDHIVYATADVELGVRPSSAPWACARSPASSSCGEERPR